MIKKRRFVGEEINLTPLLDVLFVIVFTVLLSGFSNQASSNSKIENMKQDNAKLQKQLQQYKNQNEAYEMYASQAVILSVDNITKEKRHVLRICNETDVKEIVLGNDNVATFTKQIGAYIDNLIEETDNQPIYIVLLCDEDNIYKVEYDAIDKELRLLESNNKEVFYKSIEKR